ncbi:MAG: TIM barrel protein [Acidimicrobiales bacterium]
MDLSRFSVNCSIIFTELPLLDRAEAAASAGFSAVEFWWPFASASPETNDLDTFVRSIEDAGVSLSGLNFFAGDMAGGDRGILSAVTRGSEFNDNVAVIRHLADVTGCRVFNALYGNRLSDESPEAQDQVALERLSDLASFTDATGAAVVLEPLSAVADYPLLTAAQAVKVIDDLHESGATTKVQLLADLYHLAVNGDDVSNVIASYAPYIGHVQIADAPGRNEPGTGELPIGAWLEELTAIGYSSLVGLEYRPLTSSVESFQFLSTLS